MSPALFLPMSSRRLLCPVLVFFCCAPPSPQPPRRPLWPLHLRPLQPLLPEPPCATAVARSSPLVARPPSRRTWRRHSRQRPLNCPPPPPRLDCRSISKRLCRPPLTLCSLLNPTTVETRRLSVHLPSRSRRINKARSSSLPRPSSVPSIAPACAFAHASLWPVSIRLMLRNRTLFNFTALWCAYSIDRARIRSSCCMRSWQLFPIFRNLLIHTVSVASKE